MKTKTRRSITATRLRTLLHYNARTGQFKWIRKGHGYRKTCGNIQIAHKSSLQYLRIKVDHRIYFAHRLAWLWMTGYHPRLDIDHINRNGLDNRWLNLRLVSRSQNHRNHRRYKNNKSGTTGVFFDKRAKRWGVSLINKIIGLFDSKSQAVQKAKSLRIGWGNE